MHGLETQSGSFNPNTKYDDPVDKAVFGNLTLCIAYSGILFWSGSLAGTQGRLFDVLYVCSFNKLLEYI